ncbi:MAG: UDP-N-acetylmuramoyl-tripeptide--D-alanyl-D-alanine ligase [Candidatus Zixiibacteriota bacterium]
MFEIALRELTEVVRGEIKADPSPGIKLIRGISIDSRSIEKDNLFIAIPGERFDGHQFVEEAAKRGAKAAIVAKERIDAVPADNVRNMALIWVDDTKKALRDVASWHRRKFDLPTVAITGTNGKTTTKDMTAEVLSSKFRVLKSPESYNNLVGVPLTLFGLDSSTEALVLELGMSSPGEIGILTRMSSPTVGVITNIGPAHLESMEDTEKIAQAKFELPDNMPSPKILVLNADDRILAHRIKQSRADEQVISFAIKNRADLGADRIEANGDGNVSFRVNRSLVVSLKLLGWHNVYNALAAFAVGKLLGVSENDIKESLERCTPANRRMELIQVGDIRIINDSYNANPVSMERALETLKNVKTPGRKLAVLADMLELGEESLHFHLELGKRVTQSGVNLLLLVGELARFIGQGAKEAGMKAESVLTFENNRQIGTYLLENLKEGDLLLVKGSRKMKTEEIVLTLRSQYGRQN